MVHVIKISSEQNTGHKLLYFNYYNFLNLKMYTLAGTLYQDFDKIDTANHKK